MPPLHANRPKTTPHAGDGAQSGSARRPKLGDPGHWSTRVVDRLLRALAPYSRFVRRLALRELHRRGEVLKAAALADRLGDPGGVRVGYFRQAREVLGRGVPEPVRAAALSRPPNRKVLVALHQSRPHLQSGYAIRSHHILSNVRAHGIEAFAVTRMGFPQDRGLPLDPGVREEFVDGVLYRRLPAGRAAFEEAPDGDYVEEYASALARLVERYDCSVVHGASNYLNGRGAILAGYLTGARSIYEVRGLWYLSRLVKVPSLEGSDELRYREQMELATMRDADSVVVISEALGAHLRVRGIPAERITVIPNAVDPERFLPAERDEDLARELGLEGKFVVGFLGGLGLYEGLDVLLEAVGRLVRERADLALLIVGDGPARPSLKAGARAKGLSGVVRLPGAVPFEEVQRYYSLFDACPFPRETHAVTKLVPPLKILEAMAMGKPVVVSELAPLLEMVEPGVTGLSARAGDPSSLCESLRALYEDAPLRSELARNGRDWVIRERSWRKMSARYLPLYGVV